MHSKGQEAIMWTILGIILVAIFFGVIAVSYKSAFTGLDEKASFTACKSSNSFRVANMVKYGYSGTTDYSLIKEHFGPLACSTWDKTVKGSQEEVQDQMGQLVGKCWEQFLEGKYSPMFGDISNYRDRCFICYTVQIEKIDEGKPIDGEEYFLKLETINYDVGGKKVNVLDYVQRNGYLAFAEDPATQKPILLLESKSRQGEAHTYAIAFASDGWGDRSQDSYVAYIKNQFTNWFGRSDNLPKNSILIDELGRLSQHCSIERGVGGI